MTSTVPLTWHRDPEDDSYHILLSVKRNLSQRVIPVIFLVSGVQIYLRRESLRFNCWASEVSMAVLLAWILCPIVFGVCFVSQTAYFLYKMLRSRETNYSESEPVTTIRLSETEVSCCMGWAWTSCMDKATNRMTLKAFIAWYVVALCLDVILTLLFYLIFGHFNRVYV